VIRSADLPLILFVTPFHRPAAMARGALLLVRYRAHDEAVVVGSLLALLLLCLIVFVPLRVVPALRHGRMVVLDRPKPCSMGDAQHALDRLIRAGFDAEIVEDANNGMNMWANTMVAGEVKPDERYVIQVPKAGEGSQLGVNTEPNCRDVRVSLVSAPPKPTIRAVVESFGDRSVWVS